MTQKQRPHLAHRRRAMGYTQEGLAEKVSVDRSTVVRWESGETEPKPKFRHRLATALDVSLEDLDCLLLSTAQPTEMNTIGIHIPAVSPETIDGGDVTDRRSFTFTAGVAALGTFGPMRGALAATDVPQRIGTDHLRWLAATTEGFEKADAAVGGDACCDAAIGLYQRVSRWAQESSFSRKVGEGLQAALGDLEGWAGWLALDAERRPESRRYLQAALIRARLTDDPAMEVRALQQLAMLLRDTRPRESLRYAEAALRVSTGWATPRLLTLLHLRAARAHASLRNVAGFERCMAKAKIQFENGARDEDPSYLGFVSPLEISGIEGLSYLVLGDQTRAAAVFRAVADRPEPIYQRNHALCTVRLAEATRQEGDLRGAAEIGLGVLPSVTALRSTRTKRCYAGLRTRLDQHKDQVPAVREFVEAYDAALTA